MNIDKAQEIYDNQLYEDDNICLRCNEEEVEKGSEYCEICNEIMNSFNIGKFKETRETY